MNAWAVAAAIEEVTNLKAHDHPEYAIEAEYLTKVLEATELSIADIESRLWRPSGKIADEETDEILRGWAEFRKLTLRQSRHKPYFGRIDLAGGPSSSYYIGQTGVKQPESRERLVIDWRAQVASAFYRPGPDVHLKRRFDIDAGRLVEIFDDKTEPGAGRESDPVLVQILAGSRGQDLRSIVATIQSEQDELIRADDKFLLIQGGAGTGKTVVALHRLAYLLYTYRVETRRQKELRVAVFGPNRLFLSYVASVLPSLGEADVFHTTFDDWFARWCGRDAVKLPAWDEALDRLIGQRRPDARSADALERARLKGSLRMAALLDRLGADYRAGVVVRLRNQRFAFDVPIAYRPALRLSVGPHDLERITHEAESQPLNRGREWVRQWLWPRLRAQLDRRYGETVGETGKAPQKVASAARQAFDAALDERWPVLQFKRIYQSLLSDPDALVILGGDIFEPPELTLLESSKLDIDDLAPLAYTRLLVDGPAHLRDTRGQETEQIQQFDHLVVDEAQDLAPLQLAVLRAHAGGATVLGDTAQGINPFRGTRDWSEIEDVLRSEVGAGHRVTLRQSYRSTRPIIEFANHILDQLGVAADEHLQAFPREGEPPQLIHADTEEAMVQEIAAVLDDLAGAEFQSAAVICKTAVDAQRVASRLEQRLRAPFALITRATDSRAADILVLPGYLAKGMDFDVVLVVGADDRTYTNALLDAKLLYVAVTRALHRLYVLWTGGRSPLLEPK
jgi:DNA helicase-2/ATP-dependent DNA helicase PcrA